MSQMSNPKDTFVRESEEGITELNNALLDLESDPDDDDAMESIFRTAHTLKGNAAAMGFEEFSELAHVMEDLLDEVRDDEIPVTTELMDLLFEAVDALDAMLSEVDRAGETSTDASDVVSRLRRIVEDGPDEGADAESDADAAETDTEPIASDAEAPTDDEPADGQPAGDVSDADSDVPDADSDVPDADSDVSDSSDVPAESDSGDVPAESDSSDVPAESDSGDVPADAEPADDAAPADASEEHTTVVDAEHGLTPDDDEGVYRARVDLGDPGMPGVDAMFVLEGIEDEYAMETDPERDAVENGEFDETFDVFVAADSHGAVAETVESIGQVDSAEVATVEPAADEADEPADDGSTDAPNDGSTNAADDGSTDAADDGSTDASDLFDTPETAAESADTDAEEPAEEPGEELDEDLKALFGVGDTETKNTTEETEDETISSVRVDVEQLDDLYGLVEQLVTSRIKLRREMEEADIASENLDELDKISSSLQNTVMDMRLIPLSAVVDTFPRLVRDLARDQDKKVDFEIDGRDIELDRTILTEIRDPLVHILRNAVDHGIEPPAERRAAGKSETGSIELRASRERDHVNIVVEDDGGGIDADGLRKKAVDEGIKTVDEVESMTDKEARELIFHPGFSTNEEVTDVSGRGVGMDVVRTTVKELDGQVDLHSTLGEGTRFELRLPVTVAIVRVMFVEVGGTEYGIPIKNIAEVTRSDEIEIANNEEVVRHNDELYPVIRLSRALQTDAGGQIAADGGDFEFADADGDGMLVRIRENTRQVALRCDEVLHQEEVVVKPLEGVLSGIPGLSGTAVLGDGDVVTILDVETLDAEGV